ncbi:MAG: UbiD family decarboxylase [Candidatus Bathyarchaeota archaeon]|nr:UbiD family decarboxylase [Candidatus Bathyarchaeota archaeon]MDH5787296.1 UbiD family decarboxylase [Candidatus Bathyarchaeota archaeon]
MSLKAFLKQMEKENEVLHVKDEISARFETSFIVKNFDSQGPILLFEKVKTYETKVVANVCGTRKRICAALDTDQDELYRKLTEAWRSPKKPKIVGDGAVKEISERDLSNIPILTHFARDAGPYITSAVVYAKSVDGNVENVSVHRLQVLDNKRLAIRLVPRHLFKLWQMAKEAGKDLEVSISIGVHPAILLAASSPVPFGMNEFDVANTLMSDRLRLVECKHVDAYAPAEAELVLEGKISATEEVDEGPFVDITGTYDVVRKQPVVKVMCVMHRRNYVYHGLLPSGAEHKLLMGLPHEVLIWEAASKVVPKVYAVNLSAGGSGWLHAIISIEKQLDGDGKNALLAAFAAHPSLKHAIVVDSDVDAFDASDVEWAIATRFQASEDLITIKNVRGSTLDSSADQETGLTTKVGVDATRPFSRPKEKFERAKIPVNESMEKLVRNLLGPGSKSFAHEFIYKISRN